MGNYPNCNNCTNLEVVGITNLKINQIISFKGMLSNCLSLTKIKFTDFYAPEITDDPCSGHHETCDPKPGL